LAVLRIVSDALYRAIVGVQVEPLRKIDEVPTPYRQTHPAPLAPESEAEQPPITQDDVQ
jgi:hypothetical protein